MIPISRRHSSGVKDRATHLTDQASRLAGHAVSTVRIFISAEERIRQRLRAILRVGVATIFFAISGLISLGANVTTAFAKKVNSERGTHGHTLRHKRAGIHGKAIHSRRFRSPSRLAASTKHAHSQMRGVASWYGNEFHNRLTASGVRFNTHAMMAAHRSLPFGTKVRVTNLANHKSCVVEITDRGPFSRGRIIDLSYAAAEKLGMTEAGVANVELEVMGIREPNSFEDIAFEKNHPVFDRIPNGSAGTIPSMAVDEMVP